MDNEVNERASIIFSALGHPTRLQITYLLCQDPLSVNEIASTLHLARTGASSHLAILARAEILSVTQRASTRIYSVRGPQILNDPRVDDPFLRYSRLEGANRY